MEETLNTTPLNAWHWKQGANMADFGGFEMPLWYKTGVKNEHLGVINSAGIFDTSHMACIMVIGKDALKLLQQCHTRDLSTLKNGRCAYGAILNEKGHVIDDAIVYRFDETDYMVCVNAGMGEAVSTHFETCREEASVIIDDLSQRLGKIDVQGKNAAKIIAQIIENPETVFTEMPYFSFKGHFDENSTQACAVRLKNDIPILLSRSGYTGEFGFEIFISPHATVEVWETLLKIGKEFDIIPCGLGARDSLRAGAVLPLSHQDIGDWKFINHPWMFALPLDKEGIKFTKNFIGKEALLDPSDTKFTYPFAGENLRKVGAGEDSSVIDVNGKVIGKVLTCATDMAIGWSGDKIFSVASPDKPKDFTPKGISCGFVRVDRRLETGEKLILKEKKRKINVTIVKDVRPDRTARKKITHFI